MPDSDYTKLIEACHTCGPKWLPYITSLAIETAMRQLEIRRIHWDHVFEMHIHLPETKNGESRDVPLTEEASAVIEQIRLNLLRRNDRRMFGDPDQPVCAGGITLHAVVREFADAVAWAMKWPDGLRQKHTFHDLRHVAITELKKDHVDAMDLAKTTGHKTVNLLHKVYYNPDPGDRAADIRARRAARRNKAMGQ
ncbi:MAG: tyrosine-type recombinase/integrase [Acetobacter sp.]